MPLGSSLLPVLFDLSLPASKYASEKRPSRYERISKNSESAFTAFVPTPFMPAENWKFSVSNFAPVFILLTQSTTLSSGMPRP